MYLDEEGRICNRFWSGGWGARHDSHPIVVASPSAMGHWGTCPSISNNNFFQLIPEPSIVVDSVWFPVCEAFYTILIKSTKIAFGGALPGTTPSYNVSRYRIVGWGRTPLPIPHSLDSVIRCLSLVNYWLSVLTSVPISRRPHHSALLDFDLILPYAFFITQRWRI